MGMANGREKAKKNCRNQGGSIIICQNVNKSEPQS